MVPRFAVKIAYIGKSYHGFQRQKEGIETVEGKIVNALHQLKIINKLEKSRYSAAGRTDAGVNALAQVIAFDSLREKIYLEEINQVLPDDIYAWEIAEVEPQFNARRDAKYRTYKYFIPYSNENIEQMKKGLKKLLGTHNFVNLCKKPDVLPSGQTKSTILTLEKASVKLIKERELLEFEFTSQSFLWKQVRKMVSLILDIGREKYSLEIIDETLNPKNKGPKGGIKPVRPEGLVLYDVDYDDISFKAIEKKELISYQLLEKLNSYSSTVAVLDLLKKIIL